MSWDEVHIVFRRNLNFRGSEVLKVFASKKEAWRFVEKEAREFAREEGDVYRVSNGFEVQVVTEEAGLIRTVFFVSPFDVQANPLEQLAGCRMNTEFFAIGDEVVFLENHSSGGPFGYEISRGTRCRVEAFAGPYVVDLRVSEGVNMHVHHRILARVTRKIPALQHLAEAAE